MKSVQSLKNENVEEDLTRPIRTQELDIELSQFHNTNQAAIHTALEYSKTVREEFNNILRLLETEDGMV